MTNETNVSGRDKCLSKLKEKYNYLRDKILQPNKLFYLKIMLGLSMLAIIIIELKKNLVHKVLIYVRRH